MAKKIKLGLLGCGTVGTGVLKVLQENYHDIRAKIGNDIEVSKVLVRNLNKKRDFNGDVVFTDNIDDILNDESIDIVVELLGGIHPAREYMLKAMENGKHVVTANKDVLAQFGKDMFDAAEKHDVDFMFEASVAGGIPIITPLKQCLTANKITELIGIVNGTTNYMLTKMTEQGMDYDTALARAQAKGYAEADPTADVAGLDAARKAAILSSIAFNTRVSLEDVKVEGITNITPEDITYAKELGCEHPEIVLHLDHGDTFETCKSCIDSGFSSVMIDGSHLPYEENVALTKKVVDYAHQFDVTVEGELGVLAGVEDEVSSDHHTYTDPEEVIDFATRTGCDSLAISIGTSHGAYKFTPEQCHIDPATGRMVPPPLAFEVLDAVMEKLPGFPIVLHGSSSVPQEEVETINKYGGALKAAIGIPEEELRKAAKSAVCKINIDSDSRLAMTAAIRQTFAEKPAEFDPRKYLGPARDNMEKLYKHKIINVLGSDNKLAE